MDAVRCHHRHLRKPTDSSELQSIKGLVAPSWPEACSELISVTRTDDLHAVVLIISPFKESQPRSANHHGRPCPSRPRRHQSPSTFVGTPVFRSNLTAFFGVGLCERLIVISRRARFTRPVVDKIHMGICRRDYRQPTTSQSWFKRIRIP